MTYQVNQPSIRERFSYNLLANTDKFTEALFIAFTKSDFVEAAEVDVVSLRFFFLTSLTVEGITIGTDGVVIVLNCFVFFKLSLNFLVFISFCFILKYNYEHL